MTLSRRDFLRIFGLTAGTITVGTHFNWFIPAPPPGTPQFISGRTLTYTTITQHATDNAPIIQNVWADTILPIQGMENGWYRTIDGYIRQEAVQPMQPFNAQAPDLPGRFPFWAEVASGVAAVRAYAAPTARLISRIGHGGILTVRDALQDDHGDIWYQLADSAMQPLGWSQAVHWRRTEPAAQRSPHHPVLYLDRHQGLLSATEAGQTLLQTVVTVPASLRAGAYTAQQINAPSQTIQDSDQTFYGVPYSWQVLNGPALHAAYWHNQFGQQRPNSDTIQVNILAGKWLYRWASNVIQINVT